MPEKYMTELGPTWRRIDKVPPPTGVKLLFRSLYGGVVVGTWYKESGWAFWAPLPKHTPEDKEWIKSRATGRFADGEPYGS